MSSSWDVLYIGFVLGHAGDALQMLDLATGVRDRGSRVKIVVPELPTSVDFARRCEERGMPCERTPRVAADMTNARQCLPALLRQFRADRAQIVHLHTGDVCLPRMAILAMDLLRMPRAFATLQSPYETVEPGSARAKFWSSAVRRRFHKVVSPSEHGRAYQERLGAPPDRLATVRNSIDVARFASGDARKARTVLGVDAGTPLVVFTSRMDHQKRPIEAVQAFAAVADEFPNALLVFVGTGEHEELVREEAAKRHITDRVRLVGYQSNIPDWLTAATVWILPTETENFSVAVLEALAAGCPILTTNCPGNDEVLVDGENAVLVGVGDVTAASSALRALLGDRDLRARLCTGARATSQVYTVDRMVEEYLAIYEMTAASGRRTSRGV